MADELERKWVIDPDKIPKDLRVLKTEPILQGYLESPFPDLLELRLRKKGNIYFFTSKIGKGKGRLETESEIDRKNFGRLWSGTEGRRLRKTRYEFPYEGYIIELDRYIGAFHSSLEGKVTAEVEFDTPEEMHEFVGPDWFGREVSEDTRYSNFELACNGWPEY